MTTRAALTFKIFRGDHLLREETLSQGVIKIGKVQSAHLRLDDESVSRMHAILEIDARGAVHVIDLGSTRGTFVNGHRINKAKLESGDALQIGELRVEVTIAVPTVVVETPVVEPVRATPVFAVVPPPMPQRAAAGTSPFATVPPESGEDLAGAKAIEVATMLGDSVVDVKHCLDPKSGKVSRTTWLTLGAGVACVLASAAAFAVSVENAAYNKGAFEYWTRVAHKPAGSFRPHLLSFGYDWLAFGGFALGLVALAAGLMRMRNEKKSPYYRIGTAPGVEQPVEGAPAASFPLVAPSGDDFVFNYGAGMDGELVVDGTSTTLAELVASGRARPSMSVAGALELPIPARARIRARAGQTTFLVSAVAQPRRYVTPLLAGLESRTMSYFAGSLAAHLGIWALLQQIPEDGGAATIEIGTHELAGISSSSSEKEDVPPPEDDKTDGLSGTDGVGKTAMGLEGQAGTTQSTNVDSHMRMKRNADQPQLSRQQALEEARSAGILGSASALSGGFASLDAVANISSGLDNANVYGAMFGAEGEGHGSFGYGRNGFDAGGGCSLPPCGIIGTGRYGTIGTGTHAGDGWGGPGSGGPGTRRHNAGVPPVVIGLPTGGGQDDKAIIRRYIKRNIEKISYCYEHELLANNGMEGEVTISFFITPTGSVTGSTGKGFNSTVASCVADVIGHIEFPRPANGGGVQVNYPFNFHAAGK